MIYDPSLLADYHDLAYRLEETGMFRVLQALEPEPVESPYDPPRAGHETVVIVDVETTGLDHRRHEVIELGMVRFEHLRGTVMRVTGELSQLREPAEPISQEITALTGITGEMVAGQSIDHDTVGAMLAGADLVVAHNAKFDRPFCESLHRSFAVMPWACSVEEVDWRAARFEGAKLGHLLMQAGRFHTGHRALDDCRALLHLLQRLGADGLEPDGGENILFELLTLAAQTRTRIWAENAPFHHKDVLKARGYRWNPGGSRTPKAWWRDVSEGQVPFEMGYLQREIYGYPVKLRTDRMTACDRYKAL